MQADQISLRNAISGDTYRVLSVVAEERETNETVVLQEEDLGDDEWVFQADDLPASLRSMVVTIEGDRVTARFDYTGTEHAWTFTEGPDDVLFPMEHRQGGETYSAVFHDLPEFVVREVERQTDLEIVEG